MFNRIMGVGPSRQLEQSNFPAPRKTRSGKQWPDWLAVELANYQLAADSLYRAKRVKATVMSLFSLSAFVFYFLLAGNPVNAAWIFVATIPLFGVSIVAVPFAIRNEKRKERQRVEMARRFFSIGLRIDDRGRLVTNNPLAEVVLDLRDEVVSVDPAGGRELSVLCQS